MSLACGDYKTDSQECCARKEAGGAGTGAPLDSDPLEAKVQRPCPSSLPESPSLSQCAFPKTNFRLKK